MKIWDGLNQIKSLRKNLFCESPNAKGNRQSDHDHVHKQSLNQVMKFVRTPCVKGGERQNDKTHYQFNRSAEEQTAHQRVHL